MSHDDTLPTSQLGSLLDEGAASRVSLLVVGDGVFHTFPLPARGAVLIGRGDDAQVRIEDPQLSRRHAVIHVDAELAVEDVGSANGVRVRGEIIPKGTRVAIAPGDSIELGATTIVVQRGPTRVHQHAAAKAPEPPQSARPPESKATAHGAIVVEDPAMERLYRLVDRIAMGEISVVLLGETGVGKEVFAEMIHRRSPRRDGPYLRLNCASLTESLLESELFGHERGAFTGATQKRGLLEEAHGGTVFLDEVGDLPLPIQAKLLRVLEDREVRRVGALTSRAVDVRFVAATNRDLEGEVQRGTFRSDLYYRLNGVTVVVPPLRERRAEIIPLAHSFAREAARRARRSEPELLPDAVAALLAHSWPGNVRELKNAIQRAVLLADSAVGAEHLPIRPPAQPEPAAQRSPSARPAPTSLKGEIESLERERILDALDRSAGNQTQAAKMLGMTRKYLVSRLETYGVPRPRKGR